jgi:hypothetical protein
MSHGIGTIRQRVDKRSLILCHYLNRPEGVLLNFACKQVSWSLDCRKIFSKKESFFLEKLNPEKTRSF